MVENLWIVKSNFFMNHHSTYEEVHEDEFEEGDYGDEEVANMEDKLWPHECMHNVHTYTKVVHKFEKERKRKRGVRMHALGGITKPKQLGGLAGSWPICGRPTSRRLLATSTCCIGTCEPRQGK